ncbi:MAG TPA: hypothetical protein DDW52_08365 [Planctomycetaceae bacterium]|nr:hypothetical protein [Planctomycetaceae bacterium]
MVAGAGLLYTSENYYIVRGNEGVHVVPKIAGKIEFPYRDIRNFTVDDWRNNVSLGAAIVKADKSELMVDSLSNVRANFDSLLNSLGE